MIRTGTKAVAAIAAAAALLLAGCSGGGGGGGSDDGPSRSGPNPSGSGGDDGRVRGMTLPSWSVDDYASSRAPAYLRDIASTGARWVVFTPTWYQRTTKDSEQHPTEETASDASLRRITDLAHKAGLKVMLKPHVDLVDGTDRAEIRPADRAAWFASYEKFITHYATLAQDTGIERLSVGTELAGVSGDLAAWRKVITAVRARYKKPLTYAANYDEYAKIPFWPELDVIGIDAYWPLASKATTDPAALSRAWQPIVGELAAFSGRQHRKILFTEAGYTSQRGTATAPYSWTVSKKDGSDEQAAAYRALLDTFAGRDWWAGVCWWMWDDWPDSGETPAKLAYTPHGKPAEQVLRERWTKPID
ncbi:glycoside hydrolase family 113 [Streptomyces sp. NPDC048696]|uniref:glycoside hydrolase family 113 n=1 Tax=Streptomyces sp. NPDC048696 TaxID=3365585 RepID=UPI00371EE055